MSTDRKPSGNNAEKTVGIPQFKQNANYEWDPAEKFVILGEELSIIMKSLQSAGDVPEFRRYAAIYQGLSTINNIFKEGVEQGMIKEVKSSTPQVYKEDVQTIEAE